MVWTDHGRPCWRAVASWWWRTAPAFYNYDNAQTKLWTFDGFTGAITNHMAWDSGPGNWDRSRTKPAP